jgi:hypothetical protein
MAERPSSPIRTSLLLLLLGLAVTLLLVRMLIPPGGQPDAMDEHSRTVRPNDADAIEAPGQADEMHRAQLGSVGPLDAGAETDEPPGPAAAPAGEAEATRSVPTWETTVRVIDDGNRPVRGATVEIWQDDTVEQYAARIRAVHERGREEVGSDWEAIKAWAEPRLEGLGDDLQHPTWGPPLGTGRSDADGRAVGRPLASQGPAGGAEHLTGGQASRPRCGPFPTVLCPVLPT